MISPGTGGGAGPPQPWLGRRGGRGRSRRAASPGRPIVAVIDGPSKTCVPPIVAGVVAPAPSGGSVTVPIVPPTLATTK